MRDGNEEEIIDIVADALCLKPTYEGWKLVARAIISNTGSRLKPTYEGWKQWNINCTLFARLGLKPTYEGWKLIPTCFHSTGSTSFEAYL